MKTAIISGGSSGIGEATVKCFLDHHYRVIVLDIQKPAITHENLVYLSCNMAHLSALHDAVQQISQTEEHIDALVCNAGIHFSAPILMTHEVDFDRVMNINFKSAFFLTQAILPLLLKQRKGAIVYVGSDQTLIAKHNSAIYGASKAALGSLAKTTALDYARNGIRANLVAPGSIDTPLYRQAVQKYCARTGASEEKAHQTEAEQQPLGRIGQPEEVAKLIYFLCSDEASFITGAIYSVDGGYTAQ